MDRLRPLQTSESWHSLYYSKRDGTPPFHSCRCRLSFIVITIKIVCRSSLVCQRTVYRDFGPSASLQRKKRDVTTNKFTLSKDDEGALQIYMVLCAKYCNSTGV